MKAGRRKLRGHDVVCSVACLAGDIFGTVRTARADHLRMKRMLPGRVAVAGPAIHGRYRVLVRNVFRIESRMTRNAEEACMGRGGKEFLVNKQRDLFPAPLHRQVGVAMAHEAIFPCLADQGNAQHAGQKCREGKSERRSAYWRVQDHEMRIVRFKKITQRPLGAECSL